MSIINNNNIPMICKDVYPPRKEYLDNRSIALSIEKTRSNRTVSQVRAALLKAARWNKNIKTLSVAFLDGALYQHAWVEKVVKEKLEPHIGIKFLFSNKIYDPVVTISFDRNKGSYAYVGNQCLEKTTKESMNLSWIDPPGNAYGGSFTWKGVEYKVPAGEPRNGNNIGGTVLHEFCHVLGLIHEHQNPSNNTIQWNVDKLMQIFSGPPNNWDKKLIQHNIIDRYDEDQINGTKYDPKSIMLYFYPPQVTLDNKGTSANYKLSDLDKKFLSFIYPPDGSEPLETEMLPEFENTFEQHNNNNNISLVDIFENTSASPQYMAIIIIIIAMLLLVAFQMS